MTSKQVIATLATALAFGTVGTAARADGPDDMSFSGSFKMDRIDSNKDGMVSKAEFLAAMGKMWDMKAKKMSAKDGMLDAKQMKEIEMYFKGGG